MTWYLIITLIGSHGYAVHHIEFTSLEACKNAEGAYRQSLINYNTTRGFGEQKVDEMSATTCVPRDVR